MTLPTRPSGKGCCEGEPENLFVRVLDAFDEGLELDRSSAFRFALTFSLLGFIFGLYLVAAHLGVNTIEGDEPSYHSGGKILRFLLVLAGISTFNFFFLLALYVSLRPWALRTTLEQLHILRRGFGIQLERRGQEVECTAEVEANAADGVVEQAEALLRRFWTTRHLRRDRDFLEAIVRPKGVFTPARSPWVELKVHRDGRKVRFVARHYTRNRPEQEPFDVGASLVLLGALISLGRGKAAPTQPPKGWSDRVRRSEKAPFGRHWSRPRSRPRPTKGRSARSITPLEIEGLLSDPFLLASPQHLLA
ncbi:MAG: hypothetical protein KatS3mg076_0096 [Candidatus Binatia bacterium]|nr:MAG: hypothetical protein KatS3mg076_0096 [Candidatus Binatia bacterium]